MNFFKQFEGRPDWATSVGIHSLIPNYRQRRAQFEEILSRKEPLQYPLLPLQKKSVANAAALNYHMLADDMGLGKTAQSLAVDALGGHQKTLILCPSNVKKVWKAEIEKFLGLKQRHVYVGAGKDFVDLGSKVIRHFRFFIFNYEVLNVADKTPTVIPPVLLECTHHILDEVHAMRNAEAKKTMYYEFMLGQNPPPGLTLLSGTPVDRYIGELYVYLSLLDKNPHSRVKRALEYWFPNATLFGDRYGMGKDNDGVVSSVRDYSGFHQTDRTQREIYDLIGPRICQRKIEEVVTLPKKNTTEVFIPNGAFININMEEVRETFKRALQMAMRGRGGWKKFDKSADEEGKGVDPDLLFMAQTQKLRKQIAEAMVPFTLGRAVQNREKLGPVVVFSEFLSPLDLFKANIEKTGKRCLMAIGQQRMPLWERDNNIRMFKEGRADYLLATYGAMSEGENLQQFRCLMYNDLSWQPLIMKQSERRIWRIGQENEVFIDYMLCSADQTIRNTLENKTKMIQAFEGILQKTKKEYGLV